MNNKLSTKQNIKILISPTSYSIENDSRLLIPFIEDNKIGFANNNGEIIVEPQFSMYYGECYNNNDLIKVAVPNPRTSIKSGDNVSTYQRPLYGLINAEGKFILEPIYYNITPSIGQIKLYTVQNKKYQHGVINSKGVEIVPFGKYKWIDGFDHGLSRVNLYFNNNEHKIVVKKWGIINSEGEEVVPVEYDEIWNFYDKERITTIAFKNKKIINISLKDLLNTADKSIYKNDIYNDELEEGYGTHYGEYAGTYAQDVAGFSDDVIDDAFDGEPDAYWNID